MKIKDVKFILGNLTETEDGCKIWPFRKDKDGYAVACVKIDGVFVERVGRIVLSLKQGRLLPRELLACHTCDNPACVSEKHLWAGTPKQNSEDMVRKGRVCRGLAHWATGNGHLLSGKNNPAYGKVYRSGKNHYMFGKGSRIAGANNPMYGRRGEKAPAFGRTGKKHPMFGKKGESHPLYGKTSPHTALRHEINRSHYWGA